MFRYGTGRLVIWGSAMATPKDTIWRLDPHTVAKHEMLRRYLSAWFPILNQPGQSVVYIDGFSGPGKYSGGEEGSPLRAVHVAATHKSKLTGEIKFWFIEEREDRAEHLRGELQKLATPPNFRLRVENGLFEDRLTAELNRLDKEGESPVPIFAFIDPFGFKGFPFSLVRRLLNRPQCEVLITFMVNAINRWLEHPTSSIVDHITEAFGTGEAKEIAASGGTHRISALRELYQSRLRSIAKYVRYFEMRDRQDKPQYYLFFAGNHELGHLKMKEAMWGVDPDGNFRFSDATVPSQTVLFEADPKQPLLDLLRAEFRGKGIVDAAEIRRFVEQGTPFLGKQ